MDKEVVIVGQSIAGLILSAQLRQRGIEHAVLGRRDDPKGRFALAETLPPTAMPLLEKLNLLDLFRDTALRKTYGYHSLWGGEKLTDHNFYFYSPYRWGLKIDKEAVLEGLRKQQEPYLIDFEKNFEVHPNCTGIEVTFSSSGTVQNLRAKLVVDATGRKRAVLRQLNMASIDHDDLVAFSCHLPRVKHPALVHDTFLESFESGWGIVSGLNDDQNVMTLFSNKEAGSRLRDYQNWPATVGNTTYLRHFLTGKSDTKIVGRMANSSKAAAFCGERWLAVGDAAISFDPLSSHGITNAVYTASRAADAIYQLVREEDSSGMAEYAATLSSLFAQYLKTRNQLYRQEQRWPDSPFWSGQWIQADPDKLRTA